MKHQRKGLALITVLSILVVLFAIQWGLAQTLQQSRHRLREHKWSKTAESMAVSGLDYGQGRRARSGWVPKSIWRSPTFDGARFELKAVREGGSWKLVSTGVAGTQRVTLERRVQ